MAYKMTPKRRAALKKAQAVSARKRRGKGKGKLAKANRKNSRMKRRIALVAATGGLLGGAMGVAGAYYVRKTAGGGPKAPKTSYSGSSVVNSSSPELNRSMRKARRTGPPRSNSLKAVGYAFDTRNRWSIKPPKPARRTGPPRSNSLKAVGYASDTRNRWSIKPPKPTKGSIKPPKPTKAITGLARHRMEDKANRKRGRDGYIPSKAKFDRRRTKAQRNKYPRS